MQITEDFSFVLQSKIYQRSSGNQLLANANYVTIAIANISC